MGLLWVQAKLVLYGLGLRLNGPWGLYRFTQNRLWGRYGFGPRLNGPWALYGMDKLGGTDFIIVKYALSN